MDKQRAPRGLIGMVSASELCGTKRSLSPTRARVPSGAVRGMEGLQLTSGGVHPQTVRGRPYSAQSQARASWVLPIRFTVSEAGGATPGQAHTGSTPVPHQEPRAEAQL
jgi:hypothetical protein